MALPGLAGVAAMEGDAARALRLASAASALEENAGMWAFPPIRALPFTVGSATVGATVGARRPGNPIGWLLGMCGLLVGLDEFARAYAIYGLFIRPASLPAAALVAGSTPGRGS